MVSVGLVIEYNQHLKHCKIFVTGRYALKYVITVFFIFLYHEVTTQEGLEEAALATACVPKDVTAEDAALRLLLLQVNLLISGHCRGANHTRPSEDQLELLQRATTFRMNSCLTTVTVC